MAGHNRALNKVANDPGVITFNVPQAPKKDFMPRIGFAYSPGTSGNTSIRGGFGMGYDVLYDNIGSLSRPPQIGSTINCPDTDGRLPCNLISWPTEVFHLNSPAASPS